MNINEEAANQLISYLNSGIDLAKDQIPLVAAEILHWGILVRSIGVVVPLIILFLVAMWARADYRKEPWEKESVIIFCSVLTLPGALIIGNLFVLFKILIAPRVYLIGYLSKLL